MNVGAKYLKLYNQIYSQTIKSIQICASTATEHLVFDNYMQKVDSMENQITFDGQELFKFTATVE